MRFERIRRLAGGGGADPDPRGNEATVASIPDDALLLVPQCLRNVDKPPATVKMALEGTAANTCSVILWAQEDADAGRGAGYSEPLTQTEKGLRKFYKVTPAAVAVTVGSVVTLGEAVPGMMYLQITIQPAAAGVLKAGLV